MINNKEIEFLNNYKEDKKPTKEDLQIKKLQLQIDALEEKKKQQTQASESTLHKITRTLFYIILTPILILGFFFIECAKASTGSGRRRR